MGNSFNLLLSYKLAEKIFENTRITQFSAPKTDNLFANFEEISAKVVELHLSDHKGILFEINIPTHMPKFLIKFRQITQSGKQKFVDKTNQNDWDSYYDYTYPNCIVSKLFEIITCSFLESIQEKTFVKPHKKNIYFYKNFKKLKNTLTAVQTIANVTKDNEDILLYRRLKNEYKKQINISKQ